MANAAMFSAQEFGNALGGAVALWVSDASGYLTGVSFVVGLLVLIFLMVTCRLEPSFGAGTEREGDKTLVDTFKKYVACSEYGVRLWNNVHGLWFAFAFAAFPSGASLLSGPHCKTWMVKDGLSEGDIAAVEFAAKMVSVATMLAGGLLAKRVGLRRLIFASYAGTVVVTALLGAGFLGDTLSQSEWLLLKLIYHGSLGFHIGPQMALFQSLLDERVAATLFTFFCCLCNNARSWSTHYHGIWIEKYGYATTATLDSAVVLVPLALIWLVQPPRAHLD